MRIARRLFMYTNPFRSKWPYDLTHFVLGMVGIKFPGGHPDRGGDDTVGAVSHS
jgi:hypothetical protein